MPSRTVTSLPMSVPSASFDLHAILAGRQRRERSARPSWQDPVDLPKSEAVPSHEAVAFRPRTRCARATGRQRSPEPVHQPRFRGVRVALLRRCGHAPGPGRSLGEAQGVEALAVGCRRRARYRRSRQAWGAISRVCPAGMSTVVSTGMNRGASRAPVHEGGWLTRVRTRYELGGNGSSAGAVSEGSDAYTTRS